MHVSIRLSAESKHGEERPSVSTSYCCTCGWVLSRVPRHVRELKQQTGPPEEETDGSVWIQRPYVCIYATRLPPADDEGPEVSFLRDRLMLHERREKPKKTKKTGDTADRQLFVFVLEPGKERERPQVGKKREQASSQGRIKIPRCRRARESVKRQTARCRRTKERKKRKNSSGCNTHRGRS